MTQSNTQNPKLTLWILWGAMFFTLFIYMLVLDMTINNAKSFEAPDPEMISTLRIAFGGVAVSEIVAIFVIRRVSFFSKLGSGDIGSIEELRGKYLTTSILSYALTESIAIYGFVLSFLTHDLTYYLFFFAPAVVLYLILRPRLGRYEEQFEEQRAAASGASVDPAPDDKPSSGSW